ncbi:MAG: KTSC domain-containing protein [Ignavibacteria bacterium]|nr:KTSC domain-containing protein [Ignavibacteria bacterium]
MSKNYVTSSNVEAIGYDESSNTLRVWFLNGSVYDYLNVPSIEYNALSNAPSIGSYLARNIKGVYPYSKVG